MNLPFLLGYGTLEIEERRPRSANEPRVKRLYFAKNRRHVADDRYRGRRGFSDEWAMVPYDVGQRRQNQIDEFDRKKAAAQLRFDEQEYRHQHQINALQLQHEEERQRRRIIDAQRLNDVILHGQRIPPHYWHQMQQEMQRNQDMQRRGMRMQGQGERQQLLPPPPPDHGRPGGGGGHGGPDPRIVPISPRGGQGGGFGGGLGDRHGGGHGGGHEDSFDEDGSDESEHEGHHDDRVRGRGRSRSSGRGRHGGGRGGYRGYGEQENDIEVVPSDSEDGRPPRRIGGAHRQRLPREFRPRPRSRSRAHRSHSRPRNHSRMSARRTPSRHRRNCYTDDSDTESECEDYRNIRPISRGSLRKGRGQSRHYGDYSSDDSFENYNPKPCRRRSRY